MILYVFLKNFLYSGPKAGMINRTIAMYMITAAIGLEAKSKKMPILPSDKIKDCLIAFSAKGPKTIDKTAGATG